MKRSKKVEWTRLDNAAKIFPPTSNEKDTKVFRVACELYERVDPVLLQEALDETIEIYPLYKYVLRKGVFWYYFETGSLRPLVEEESLPVCARIYQEGKKNLLFRVLYYKNRISLEVFHALTDGTGAIWFLKSLLSRYLLKKYSDKLSGLNLKIDYDASVSQKKDDSFLKYYTGKRMSLTAKIQKAYHIKGNRKEENRMQLVEGTMSVKSVLSAAHEYNTTLTVYLTALFLYSIYKTMPERKKKYPVVLTVPVNLRNYFESVSARNFFGTILIGYHFEKNNSTKLSDVIKSVAESFSRELTQERLGNHMEKLAALEHNVFARVVPLAVKDVTLRIANFLNERGITAALSNVGKITMPTEFAPYIKQFDFFTSARRPQICVCSYEDTLTVSFTSPYTETDIQKYFFKMLTDKGIDVVIASNQ
ncbi:MAG: Alcohol acetyltransferase [Lachnoclostridium sp.]|jgi:NRPS condensation-like uncharacterized protein